MFLKGINIDFELLIINFPTILFVEFFNIVVIILVNKYFIKIERTKIWLKQGLIRQ